MVRRRKLFAARRHFSPWWLSFSLLGAFFSFPCLRLSLSLSLSSSSFSPFSHLISHDFNIYTAPGGKSLLLFVAWTAEGFLDAVREDVRMVDESASDMATQWPLW